jgi:hypothetical protein
MELVASVRGRDHLDALAAVPARHFAYMPSKWATNWSRVTAPRVGPRHLSALPLDRIERSVADAADILKRLRAGSRALRSLQEPWLDTTTAFGEALHYKVGHGPRSSCGGAHRPAAAHAGFPSGSGAPSAASSGTVAISTSPSSTGSTACGLRCAGTHGIIAM